MSLKDLIINKIKTKGPITVSEYMDDCLFNEQYGYYRIHNPLGDRGDFITAPEISQIFGELIGIWIIDLWQRSGQPGLLNLIELGPGHGTMMADILRILPEELRAKTNTHLVEVNEILINLQKQKLSGQNIHWHSSIPDAFDAISDGFTIVLANEFFDVLPIHQLIMSDSGWQERYVDCKKDKLVFSTGPVSANIYPPLTEISQIPTGSVYEICPLAFEVLTLVSEFMLKQNGAFLAFDYGFVLNTFGDTLQAVHSHSYHDILKDPGNSDLTAHINFFKFVEHLSNFDLNIFGPNLQGTFLSELGIDIRAHTLKSKATELQAAEIDRSVHRLINTTQMGELFKVLCIASKSLPKPSGFATCFTHQTSVM